MSREIQVTNNLRVIDGSQNYNRSATFVANKETTGILKGPCPGAFTVTRQGLACDLSQLTNPAFCRITNLEDADDTPNRIVEYGIADPQLARFYPLGEIYPGETFVLRLGRNLQGEFGTATGTAALTEESNRFWFRSIDPSGASAQISVEAFER